MTNDYLFEIAAGLLIALYSLVNLFVVAYVRKKGENLATKGDVAKITHEIETIRTDYEKEKIQFEWLHQQRAIALCNIYGLLNELLTIYPGLVQITKEKRKLIRTSKGRLGHELSLEELRKRMEILPQKIEESLRSSMLFLPDGILGQLNHLYSRLTELTNNYLVWTGDTEFDSYADIATVEKEVYEELEPLLGNVKASFEELLGLSGK